MSLESKAREVFEKFVDLKSGKIAEYIPELARVDPDQFALSLVSADGAVTEFGDIESEFSIQSISKPFSYSKCLESVGFENIRELVGVEPSGSDFNSIVKLSRVKRPMNPMVNSGAIAICGLLVKKFGAEATEVLLNHFSDFAGRSLSIDESMFESEWENMNLNWSLAYLLRHNGMLAASVEKSLELYAKLCSVSLTNKDLAVMGATLSNNGTNPLSNKRCLQTKDVKSTLSVMLTCGMYNYSGQWVFEIGLPAKSGVGGGVLMVVPRMMGIAVYSPRLDDLGNSVRGIAVCREISSSLCLHLLDPTRQL